MTIPSFGALIIGDEQLSGRRQDKHLPWLIETLGKRGLRLSWARFEADVPARLEAILRETFAGSEVVFSFGGIGATPDDHTRQAAAAALDRPLQLHPEAEAELRARFGSEITPQRLQLGTYPSGARIIPNPVNRVPGFAVADHWFVPGFPKMAWPMLEWVLDTHYREAFHQDDYTEASLWVLDRFEGELISIMEQLGAEFPGLTVFSLPTLVEAGEQRRIELGVKGGLAAVTAGMSRMRELLDAQQMVHAAEPPSGSR